MRPSQTPQGRHRAVPQINPFPHHSNAGHLDHEPANVSHQPSFVNDSHQNTSVPGPDPGHVSSTPSVPAEAQWYPSDYIKMSVNEPLLPLDATNLPGDVNNLVNTMLARNKILEQMLEELRRQVEGYPKAYAQN